MTIVKGSSEALETAESDRAVELSGSETVLPESPEGELLPRIQQINEQIKRKIKRLHNSAKDKIKKQNSATEAPAKFHVRKLQRRSWQ